MDSTFQSAREHPVLRTVLNALVINQFCNEYGYENKRIPIDSDDLKKAGWISSILANSPEEKHQFIAASFAKLLYLQNPNDEQKTQLSYVILSRTGNLAAARHLHTIYKNEDIKTDDKEFNKSFGVALDLEVGTKRNINRLKIKDQSFFVTDFQKRLWENLKLYDHVAISAPTSAGKSFFIQHFISQLFDSPNEFKVVYIVPTRALISQVSDVFKKILPRDVNIRTAFIDEQEITVTKDDAINRSKREIYCVTPERCLKLLQQGWKKIFRPDLIFIDEIQNVETYDNRAVLLEFILSEISKLWKGAKILFAGPFISNSKKLYKTLLEISGEEISTYLPPVYQLRLTIQNIENQTARVIIHLLNKETHAIDIDLNLKLKRYSQNKSMLAPVVKRFGKEDGNLIYAAKPNWCVSYAMEFIKEIKKANGRPSSWHPAINDLIELLKEDIHPNYYLIYCLKYKVGFHHGQLPDIVKNEIEYLFEQKHIQYLFCTSTLLQGVNLPAPRMFIVAPKKDSADLSHFEFGNLIGRAGRIKDSMIGTIFCLEKHPETEAWSSAYYTSDQYTKDVVPTTEQALKQDTEKIVSALGREPKFLKHTGDEYTNNLLKQKFISNPAAFQLFLREKELDSEKIETVSKIIETQLEKRNIPSDLVRLNPNIDPVLQNQLYEQIKADGIENWSLIDDDNGNSNFNKRDMKREDTLDLSYIEWPFYYQFEYLLEKMDKIFAIWKEALMRGVSMGTRRMAYYGITWLDSLTFSQLIEQDLDYYSVVKKDLKSEKRIEIINNRINRVIKINSVLVTYILVKYFKLLSDLLGSLMSEEQKVKYRKTLSLPTMLELGTRKIEVLIMVSMGIPRSISLKIATHIPPTHRENPIDWLSGLERPSQLPMKKFYIKYLWRKGYLVSIKKEQIDHL